MNSGGMHYKYLSMMEDFSLLSYYVDSGKVKEAYELVNEKGNQKARELTLYFLKEYGVFHSNPLSHLNYVPENYLYEAVADDLCIYVDDRIEEIITPVYYEYKPTWQVALNNYQNTHPARRPDIAPGTVMYIAAILVGAIFKGNWIIWIIATCIYAKYLIDIYRD